MSQGRLVKNPAVVCTDMDDGAVLLDLESTSYYSLNRTALRIWNLIGSNLTLAGIAARLAEEYALDYERALASAERFVTTLKGELLIREEAS